MVCELWYGNLVIAVCKVATARAEGRGWEGTCRHGMETRCWDRQVY
jgi:hypothetical protein